MAPHGSGYGLVAALLRGLSIRLQGHDDSEAFGRLKSLFAKNESRPQFSFSELLDSLRDRLLPEDHELYGALASAINDPEQRSALDGFDRWRDARPVALDTPWPDP